MTPDAKIRMDVYQEGQRAFNSGTLCPYTDWRAKTWVKGRAAAEAHAAAVIGEDTAPHPHAERDQMISAAYKATTLEELRSVLVDLINKVYA